MGSITKPHVVIVPYPAQGHVNPLMQIAKILHSKDIHITFVNTEFNHGRLRKSNLVNNDLHDFRFETIPDGLPFSDRNATQDLWALSDSLRKNCSSPFKKLVGEVNETLPISCIISDGLMSFCIEVGQELGVPNVSLWTASACGFMGYLCFRKLIHRGIVPFKDENFMSNGILDTPIDFVPGMPDMKLKDFPTLIRTTDPNDILLNFMSDETHNCLKSSAIIFHTFYDFERKVLDEITKTFPNIYTVGPFALLEKQLPEATKTKSLKSSLWKEDSSCIEWLDKREPNSVVFVSFGSITVMTCQQFREFGWGLADCKHPFLWVVRPDVVIGNAAVLDEEFYEEVSERGMLVSWCPQDDVLTHSSVGVFLTHAGWNSMLESVCGGVPVICWPFFDEQPTNSRYACNVWGIGMEVEGEVKRERVRDLVKEMMEEDRGREMRKRAQEWKMKAEEANRVGGSSYDDIDRFVSDFLHP